MMRAPAVLCTPKEEAIHVTIIDASDEGARIETRIEDKIDIFCFYKIVVPGLFKSDCFCVWHQQPQGGLQFLQPLQPGIVDELSQIFPIIPENTPCSSARGDLIFRFL